MKWWAMWKTSGRQLRGRERWRGNAGADSVTAAANDRAARASTPTPFVYVRSADGRGDRSSCVAVDAGRLLFY